MSTIKSKKVQIGTSANPTQNFTFVNDQDGTIRFTRGETGAFSGNVMIVSATDEVSFPANTTFGNLSVSSTGTYNNVSTANLSVTNNISAGNIAVTRNISTLNLSVTNNISTANLSVTNNISTGNIAVTRNISTLNLVVTNNISATNLFATNISTSNLTITTNLFASGAVANISNVIFTTSEVIFNDEVITTASTKDIGSIFVDRGRVTTNTTITFDFANGSFQRLDINSACNVAFTNFPSTGNIGFIQVEFANAGSNTVTFPNTINWIKKDGTFTNSISTYLTDFGRPALQANGTDFIIIWTRNAGANMYGKLL